MLSTKGEFVEIHTPREVIRLMVNILFYDDSRLTENIQEYFKREVLPFAPDAWIDEKKSKVGYEIPFTRYFYNRIKEQILLSKLYYIFFKSLGCT